MRRTEKNPTWHVDLKLEGVAREGQLITCQPDTDPITNGPRIEYHRGPVIEWYLNRPNGIEQGFTIERRIEGNGEIQLYLMVHGNTTPEISNDEDAIDFFSPDNAHILRYAGLHVYDSEGNVLPSSFELADNSIIIRVDDAAAAYPIIIDPLLSSPTAIEGDQKYAHFGASMKTAGDVNGDGYSDVIVGAPDFDNGTSDTQHQNFQNGKVFVFHGSSSGINTTPDWTAMCDDQTQARFGYAVGTAGDVNNDGFSDIVIGAPNYSDGQDEVGAVFVFFGGEIGLGPDATQVDADWSSEGDQANAQYGYSVGTAGDTNGNGYDDLVIGAPYYDEGQNDEGKVFVFYGNGSGFDAVPWGQDAWTYVGAHMGFSVGTAGDVNGDGYSDIVVGAPELTYPESKEGLAFVFHGSSEGVSVNGYDWFQSDCTNAYMGYSVGTAGDVNGDGYSDVIIGIPNYLCGPYDGRVTVYYGSNSGADGGGSWTLNAGNGGTNNMYVGSAVGTAGDINGDGFADVIIGGHGYPAGEAFSNRASVYLYHGSSEGLNAGATTANAEWSAVLSFPTDFLNVDPMTISVFTAGDVNGDGFSDVIVGDPFKDDIETDSGIATIYYGTGSGLEVPYKYSETEQLNSQFGKIVGVAGDLNGDGYDDVFITAPQYDDPENAEGKVMIYHGPEPLSGVAPNWNAAGNQAGRNMGKSAAAAGDVNGDGYDDFIIADGNNVAYVYHGSATGLDLGGTRTEGTPTNYDWKASGFEGTEITVHGAGDVNGDGYSDVVIGAPFVTNGQTEEGAIYVYYGSSSGLGTDALPDDADWKAEGDTIQLKFGWNATYAGDVNGDGYSDIIVGTKETGEKAFVFFGSPTGLDLNQTRTSGNPSNADWSDSEVGTLYGSAVSSAGDVNSDGFSDIIVGEYGFPSEFDTPFRKGRILVYYGSVAGPSLSPDWTAVGSANYTDFGYAVGTAGDVNHDGFSDIIVGAPALTSGPHMAYVYFGSQSGLNLDGNRPEGSTSNADWSFNYGGSTYLGNSVNTAGDLGSDGFSDVIIGDYGEDMAFVIHGNDGVGRGNKLTQQQTIESNPISRLGISDNEGSIAVSALGTTPFGRGDVKLEWEAKPVEDAFDGMNTYISDQWHDTGVTGYLFEETAAGLFGHTNYHWRARFRYPAGNPMELIASPWFSPFPGNPEETDFRTSNGPPIGGFTSNNILPASQVNQSTSETGIVTVHFRIKDGGINLCTLRSFQYRVDDDSNWVTPPNGDASDSLSVGWVNNNGILYSSATDWTGTIHSFTFNTKHSDVISDFNGIEQNEVRVRFSVNDGLAYSVLPVTSDPFSVDCVPPATGSISIVDNNGTTSDATPDLNLSSTGASQMRFALSEGGLSSGSWVPYSTSYASFNISSGGNGTKTVWVEYRDQYWNIQTTHASYSTTLDTSPVVNGDAITNDTAPTWTWDSNGGTGTYRVKINDQPWSTEITETSYTAGVLSQGLNTLYVQEWNAAGYWSWSGSFTIEIDSGRPCSQASSPTAVDDLNQTFTITYSYDDIYAGETCGSADSGSGLAKVDLFVKAPGDDDYSLVYTDSDPNIDGQFSYTAGDQGAYDFRTLATDNAGNVELGTESDTRTIFASQFSGYAILAVGSYGVDEEGLDSHTLTANNVYKHLINRNFALVDDAVDKWLDPLDYIKYYNPYAEIQTGEDDYTEGGTVGYWLAMQKAISQWALNKMTALPGPLYIILIDHGTQENFYLKHPELITASELDGWLTTLENGLALADVDEDIVIILGTCYSGSFIDDLSKPGRIIVSSAAADEPSYRGPLEPAGIRDGEFFISSLFNELGRGENLKESFLNAVERVEIHTDSGYANSAEPYFDAAMQHPYLDDDGLLPGSYNLVPGGDGDIAANIILGYETSTIDPVVVTDVVGLPETLVDNSGHSALLWAKVSDMVNTDRVWVEIRDPGTTLEGGTEQQLVDLNEFLLTLNGDRYEATYNDFWLEGTYTLFFYVKDTSGLISPFKKGYVYKELSGINTPPDAFNLLSPTDGYEVPIATILDWDDSQDSTDGHNVTYTLTISTDPDVTNPAYWVYREEGIQHSILPIDQSNGILNFTTYYWQVIAVDEYGASTESAVWSFNTDSVGNPAFGWIMGYVYNDANNEPIPYATVQFDVLTLSTDASGYYIGVRPPGNYNLTITAAGFAAYGPASIQITEGGTLEKNVTMTPSSGDTAPTATISSPDTDVVINVGDPVIFLGSVTSGNAPFTYAWDFDDGATNVAVQSPGSVTFDTAGTYTVSFTVTDADSDTDSDTVTVTVNEIVDTQPTAIIAYPALSITILPGESIGFQGSVSGGNAPFTYLWDFNGGAANATQKDPSVTFNAAGIYDVTFTVTDDDNDNDSDTVTITVDAAATDNDDDGISDGIDPDDDNDGISDTIEAAGPNGGDANNDGIQDSLQSNVVSFGTYTAQGYVVLVSPPGTLLSNCQAADNPSSGDAPTDLNFDYGFFDFTISGLTPGGSTSLTMTLPSGAAPDTYYKYGKTQTDPTDHWYPFLYNNETGAEIAGNVITLHFVDALRGDDELVQDSRVVDLGAPGFATPPDDGGGDGGGGGGGGCFIDTVGFQ